MFAYKLMKEVSNGINLREGTEDRHESEFFFPSFLLQLFQLYIYIYFSVHFQRLQKGLLTRGFDVIGIITADVESLCKVFDKYLI